MAKTTEEFLENRKILRRIKELFSQEDLIRKGFPRTTVEGWFIGYKNPGPTHISRLKVILEEHNNKTSASSPANR